MSTQEESKGRGRGRGGNKRPQTAQVKPDTEESKQVRGRGGRGGRGQKREHSADGDDEDRRQSRGGRGERGDRGGRGNYRGGRPDRERDVKREDQWIYKFHHENYRKNFDWTIPITMEMEIPVKPKQTIKEPSKDQMNSKLEEKDREIKKLTDEKAKLIKKKRERVEGGRIGNTNTTYREQMNNLISEQKKIQTTKRNLNSEMRAASQALDDLDMKKRTYLKNMHNKYQSEDEIQEALDDMKRRQQTTSMSAGDEERCVKDIQKLEKSLPFAQDFEKIKPAMKEHAEEKKKIWTALKAVRDESDIKSAEIDKFRAEMDKTRIDQNEVREELDTMGEGIDEKAKELTAVYEEKDQVREEYWEQMFKAREMADEIGWIDWLQEQKDLMVDNEKARSQHLEDMKQSILTIENPCKKEIANCDYLISICNRLKVRAGLLQDSEQVAKDLQKAQAEDDKAERLKKIAAGIDGKKLQLGVVKQDEQMMVIGGGKGGKKNKKKKEEKKQVAASEQYEDPFIHDISIVQMFSMVGVSPPNLPQDLDGKIDEIEAKKKEFTELGREQLEQEIEDQKKKIEAEAIEMEKVAAQERQVASEEAGNNRRPRGGNRGRGSRGGYGDRDGGRGRGARGRGGKERNDREQRQDRGADRSERQDDNMRTCDDMNEFEDKNDDDVYKSAPRTQQTNQKQNQKNQKYVFDESNFEEL